MNEKIWEKIKYWQKRYTWPCSALVGEEYRNDKQKNQSRKKDKVH